MKKRNKGNHGIYELTCISDKCSRRFKVVYDVRRVSALQQAKWAAEANVYNPKPATDYVKFTYPFTGCPFCGAWWPTGPLDASAYPPNMTNVRLTKGQVQQMTKTLRSIWDGTAGSDSAEGWR